MKVLLCHNYYQQSGGEDESFKAVAELLESHGHQVIRFTRHNDDIDRMSRLKVVQKTFWNQETYAALRAVIRREKPSLMHCTNLFPLISPAACYAGRAEGLGVIQALHNYRFCCLNSFFARNGRICEECIGKHLAWPGIVHRCYRSSRAASTVVASMNTLHRMIGTWKKTVTFFFTPTDFSRQKLIECGLAPDRIRVKPNFIHPDPGQGSGDGGYTVFVGRLSPEKGIETLLTAWHRFPGMMPLKIIGDGPLAGLVRHAAQNHQNMEWLGKMPLTEVLSVLGRAACLVMPSIGYETFGRTIIEAYSKGIPVVASRLGTMLGLVREGDTGLLFEPGNPEDLSSKIKQLINNPGDMPRMRRAARMEYEKKYTAQVNYMALMKMYNDAIRLNTEKKS